MSTHKNFDKICCIVMVLCIIITVLFVNGEKFGLVSVLRTLGYENKLFDSESVHTIDIEMDDWDSFVENATAEEYATCTLKIDNETYKNVAIRAKGNTSLTNVKNYGNNRYSFKVEFDHYDDSITYHGLDKLSLNNIIQDNTLMKDFLTYRLMDEFGVDAPLCSYTYITVNGEDWGLYLAVEGVEDSFLERNYGNENGELYKPDSQSMGGGRGNGEDFNMDDFDFEDMKSSKSDKEAVTGTADTETVEKNAVSSENGKGMMQKPDGTDSENGGQMQMPDSSSFGDMEMPDGMDFGSFEFDIDQIKTVFDKLDDDKLAEIAEALGYDSVDDMKTALENAEDIDTFLNGKSITDIIGDVKDLFGDMEMPDNLGGDVGGGMNSDDVKLIYTDDEVSSYSNIFNNAKTNITDEDKERLISSLKQLNNNENIEDVVNVEEVIRYFVVHNFVLNFDSYTGSMIHNYYLYEDDGQLSMIPWDYNLAFGGFQSASDATSLANYPIDSPVSGGDTDSRPMISWIFNNDEYLEQYHEYFADFIADYFDSGYVSDLIDSVKEMISPYVEKDPTKFCTYDEFIKGIDTLKEFCEIRAKSVSGQLNGTIPSTSDEQSNNEDSFIDASDITVSDMGSMGNGGGAGGDKGGGMEKPDGENNSADGTTPPEKPNGENNSADGTTPPEKSDGDNNSAEGMIPADNNGGNNSEVKETETTTADNSKQTATDSGNIPQMPNGEQGGDGAMPQMSDGQQSGMDNGGTPPEMPDGEQSGNGEMPQMPDNMQNGDNQNGNTSENNGNTPQKEDVSDIDMQNEDSSVVDKNNKGEIDNNRSGQTSNVFSAENIIILLCCVVILVIGLIIAKKYKKNG